MPRRRANRETFARSKLTSQSVSTRSRDRHGVRSRAVWRTRLRCVTLGFSGTLDHQVVIDAVERVSVLVARPEVAAAWAQESACTGMTVGGLTRHLISQPELVVSLLEADPTAGADAEVIDLLEHYARAAWVREDLDGAANTSIRTSSDDQAAAGVDAALDVLVGCAVAPRCGAGRSPADGLPALARVEARHRRLPRHAPDGDGRAQRRPGCQRRRPHTRVRRSRSRPGAPPADRPQSAPPRTGRSGPHALPAATRAGVSAQRSRHAAKACRRGTS